MKKISTFVFVSLIAGVALAEEPLIPTPFKDLVSFCVATKENVPMTYFLCKDTQTETKDCRSLRKVTSDQALSACVSSHLNDAQRKEWVSSPLNPLNKK